MDRRKPGWLLLTAIIGCTLTSLSVAQDKSVRKSLPAELALIPEDAFGFLHLRPADLCQSELGVKLRKHYWVQDKFVRDVLENATGHAAEDIDSISLVYPRLSDVDELTSLARRIRQPDPKESRAKALLRGDEEASKEMIVVTTTARCDRARVLRNTLGDFAEKKHKDAVYFTAKAGGQSYAVHFVNDRTFLFVNPATWMEQILDRAGRAAAGPLAASLDLAASKCPLVVGLNLAEPNAQFWKREMQENARGRVDLRELLASDTRGLGERERVFRRTIPAEFDFVRFSAADPLLTTALPLLEARSLVLWATLGKRVRVQVNLDFASEARAAAALEPLDDVLRLARMFSVTRFVQVLRTRAIDSDTPQEILFWSLLLKQTDRGMRQAALERRQSSLRLVMEGEFDLDELRKEAQSEGKDLETTEAYRQARQRRDSTGNMRRIVAAMLEYEKAHKTLPPAALCSENGKPLLSWRVALLPNLGEDGLYRQFKLDEPWDSPDNLKLLAKIPAVYQPVGAVPTEQPFATFYQVVTGPGTAFESHQAAKGTTLAQAHRLGALHSLGALPFHFALVEAFEPVSWTRPADVTYDPKGKGLPRLGGLFPDGFHAASFVGEVTFQPDAVDPATLQRRK